MAVYNTYVKVEWGGSEEPEPLDEEERDGEAAYVIHVEELHAIQLLPPDAVEAEGEDFEAPWWDGFRFEVVDDGSLVMWFAHRDDDEMFWIRARSEDGALVVEHKVVGRNVDPGFE